VFSTEAQVDEYLGSSSFADQLVDLTFYLNYSKLQANDWETERYEDLKSLKYYVAKLDGSIVASNMDDASDRVVNGWIDNSQFFVHVGIDEAGKASISSTKGKSFNNGQFLRLLPKGEEDLSGYANCEIYYIIPKSIDHYDDFFIHALRMYNFGNHGLLILTIGAMAIVFVAIMAFAINFRSQTEVPICRIYNRMYLEFKVVLLSALFFGGYFGIDLLVRSLLDYRMTSLVEVVYNTNGYFYLVGIAVTFIMLTIIYLNTVYIKYIYFNGSKKGIVEKSILGNLVLIVFRGMAKLFKSMAQIDLRKSVDRNLILILVVNFIAIAIMIFSGVLGLVFAILYTMVLFYVLLNFVGKAKILMEESNRLAEGDFDFNLNEKIGMLKPVAENMNNIKEGFKAAVEEETKSQRMKTELISNVSHDLKTPLTSIITYVDLLKNEGNSEEQKKEYLDVIDRKSKRLNILIEDLFEASMASSGNIDLHLEKVEVVDLFRQTLGELDEKISKSTLDFKVNVPENKVYCQLDGRRTYRIFENIMGNILKYSMPNSRVYVDIEELESEVNFTFKNISAYEIGFDASELTERFTRGDESRHTEGSGLGLAIAKSLIDLQDGKLEIMVDGDLFKLIVAFPKV